MLSRLDPKQAALLHDVERLWIDDNLAANGENHTLISNEYLEALAARRQFVVRLRADRMALRRLEVLGIEISRHGGHSDDPSCIAPCT